MTTRDSFRCALLIELLTWLSVGDLRLVMLYGLVVYAACRGLYVVRA